MAQQRNNRKPFLTPARIIPIGFLLLIAVGTGLLLLPCSTAPGARTDVLTALFTATTSVCVTGLVVVETAAHWTLFGKLVILLLIQLGGLGLVAVTAMIVLLLGKNVSIRGQVLLRDAFNRDSIAGQSRFLKRVIRGVLLVEGAGAALYAVAFVPRYGWLRGIWYSVFHAVSAFCNAGIDILGPDSLAPFAADPYVLLVTMALIVLGGVGFVVWFDVLSAVRARLHRSRHRLSPHSRLVLWLTAGLIAAGAALTLAGEWRNPLSLGPMPVWQKILNAFFQSVTLRTAGFATVPQGALSDPVALLSCLFMLIGGSPMGTAGGVKTVTLFLLLASAASYIQRREETVVCRRSIDPSLRQKASAIVLVSLSVSVLFTALLLWTDGLSLIDAMYEMFSATATVGLSRGVTPALSAWGRVVVILGMFLGRIGPISIGLFFGEDRTDENRVRHASGQFYVG